MNAYSEARPFTPEEAAPVLRALSKLHPVVVVNASRYFSTSLPYICWIDAEPYHLVNRSLRKYPGSGRWYLSQDLPRICLMVQPDITKGDPLPIKSESRTEAARLLAVAYQGPTIRVLPMPRNDSPF